MARRPTLSQPRVGDSPVMVAAGSVWALLAGMGLLLLNAGNPDNPDLFILVSVLISFAAIPILLSVLPQPVLRPRTRLNPLMLYRLVPMGVVGCFTTGILQSALFGMGRCTRAASA